MAVQNATSAQVSAARAAATKVLHALTVVQQHGKPRSAEAATEVNSRVSEAVTALQALASA